MGKEVTFEIVKELGVLSEGKNGWTKQVNIVKWNNGKPKLDIRDWNEDRSKMGKGITLNYDDVQLLFDILEDCKDDLDI
ncbi:hypothetical protein PBI_PBS1_289 [Bacillus phage PBS1]|uniref:Transcriptional coactivator p15 (PC4) C-terminal domain-containing protein n=1 Tax=Bacillus phage PBS1 TaxID=2884423 RepID=A0A223LEC3_BPPB1|nr:DNA binding protein [Bacillus phage PBS1]ASU00111.1 hypothetical protein PBI_PBS1_289 [Bacillus phage PBS1]BDE75380.1 hypothetical protein [Bacillus phage PBS1]